MKAFFSTNNDYGMLVLRVMAAIAMLPFGLLKVGLLTVPNLPGGIDTTVQMMAQGGIPAVITYLVMIAETIGCIALILGFCTRFCAASLAVIMIAASWFTYSMGMGYFSGYVIPFVFLVTFLPLVINGGGKWSVDAFIASKLK